VDGLFLLLREKEERKKREGTGKKSTWPITDDMLSGLSGVSEPAVSASAARISVSAVMPRADEKRSPH
jgi:hypothetical protein